MMIEFIKGQTLNCNKRDTKKWMVPQMNQEGRKKDMFRWGQAMLNLDLQKEVLNIYQHSPDATLEGCVERKEDMNLTWCSAATEVKRTSFIRDWSDHNSRIINLQKRHYLEISPATKRWVTIKKLKKNYTNTPHVNLYNEALIFIKFYSEAKKAMHQRKTLANLYLTIISLKLKNFWSHVKWRSAYCLHIVIRKHPSI